MASNDVSNLGLEADLPDELRRISADTEYDILLRYLGVNPATLNSDIWERADQERIVGTIARNISGHIAGTRHALTQLQLENLLNPRVQEAAAAVQRQNLGTPEGRQSVATVLAQAVYDALPKETWHVVTERQIRNQYGGGRVDTAPPTAEEQAALSFYERLREENDANDMIAGMALLTAINDTTTSPVAIPAAGTTPARQSWEQKYLSNNTEVVQRKNVAEIVQDLKTMQVISLPSGVAANATQVDIQGIVTNLNATGGEFEQLNNAINRQNRADGNHRRRMQTYEADVAAWEQRKAAHEAMVQAYNMDWATYHREVGVRGMTPARPTTANPGAFLEIRPAKPISRDFRQFTLTGPFATRIASIEEAHAKLAELRVMERSLQGVINEFNARHTKINALIDLLQGLNIQNIGAAFPMLTSVCTGTPLRVNPTVFPANFNFTALATEIERNMPKGLKSVEEYSKEVVESGAKRTGGMDLCRAVMRAHVKNARPGLSNADTDSVVEYIVNRTKVDNILRSSVQQGVNEYFDVDGDRTLKERLQNSWNANGRHAETVEQIGRGLRIGVIGHQPNWQAASYEQLVGAYFAIKELVEGKGPEYLHMTSRPPAVLEQLQTISRILTSKYSGAIEKKLAASLPDADKKDVTRSRARLGQAMQDFLKGDAPEWAKADVKKAHDRANAYVDWKRRGTYALGKSFVSGVGGVGSWMKNFAVGNSPTGDVVKQYGSEAAKIAAWSLLGGPVLGVAAWYLSKQFSSAK